MQSSAGSIGVVLVLPQQECSPGSHDELTGKADPPVSPVWSAGSEMSILGLKIFLDEALCNLWSWQWEALGPGGGKENRMALLGAFSSEKY